jgi:hypothetical protein
MRDSLGFERRMYRWTGIEHLDIFAAKLFWVTRWRRKNEKHETFSQLQRGEPVYFNPLPHISSGSDPPNMVEIPGGNFSPSTPL